MIGFLYSYATFFSNTLSILAVIIVITFLFLYDAMHVSTPDSIMFISSFRSFPNKTLTPLLRRLVIEFSCVNGKFVHVIWF
jgi:hypothetical protein